MRIDHLPIADRIEGLDEIRVVKNDSTPLTGGPPPIGLQASITVLPLSAAAPACFSASSATSPATANTTTSPNVAASAKDFTEAPLFFACQSLSLAGSRVPIATSCPCFKKPAPRVCATMPEPMTPIFMPVLLFCADWKGKYGRVEAPARPPAALPRQ